MDKYARTKQQVGRQIEIINIEKNNLFLSFTKSLIKKKTKYPKIIIYNGIIKKRLEKSRPGVAEQGSIITIPLVLI
ncbi:MAG: hypothetical protein ACK5IC_00895 [Moheibacter sp.]